MPVLRLATFGVAGYVIPMKMQMCRQEGKAMPFPEGKGVDSRFKVQVRDLSRGEGASESVALVYFEELQGVIHVYRDGTVVLASPAGITVASLKRRDDRVWREEQFLSMLARMGASDQELSDMARMIASREQSLSSVGFPAAVQQAARESAAHIKTWCQQRGLDYETLTEEEMDRLVDDALAEVRSG